MKVILKQATKISPHLVTTKILFQWDICNTDGIENPS